VPFEGFPREGLRFLRELREHNEKRWFDANRATYEQALLEPARDFVEAMGAELGLRVHADPRVNGSIFRINRDTRFSRDKRPYKDHLDLWFWQGEGPSRACPGYWFRLTPERLVLGAGMHHFEPELRARYRAAVGPELRRLVDALPTDAVLGGQTYKRIPPGYAGDDPLLLHSGLFAGMESKVPKETHTAAFSAYCAAWYRPLAPLVDWLERL
jgi:uncharacterized protein (TIGR02453 family)